MPNILDDIIASVVENKIPATRQSITAKLSVTPSSNGSPAPAQEENKALRKRPAAPPAAIPEDLTHQYPDIPHLWLDNRRLLWLKDHRNQNNWKLFRECWKQGQVGVGRSVGAPPSAGSADLSWRGVSCLLLACSGVRDP